MSDKASRKRVYEFLFSCVEVKKRKVDLEGLLARKRAELLRYKEQVAKMQSQIQWQTQKLSSKEAIVDALQADVDTLQLEYNVALD